MESATRAAALVILFKACEFTHSVPLAQAHDESPTRNQVNDGGVFSYPHGVVQREE